MGILRNRKLNLDNCQHSLKFNIIDYLFHAILNYADHHGAN